MRFTELFKKHNTQDVDKKSLPEGNTTVSMDTFVRTAAPISNSPLYLVSLNKGYVYDCNKLNSQTVASIPLKLYATTSTGKKIAEFAGPKALTTKQVAQIKEQSKSIRVKSAEEIVQITQHPFLDLIYQVSDSLDQFSLFELTENYLGLLGNAYWWIKSDQNGMPNEIEVLPAEFVAVRTDNEGKVTGYQMKVDYSGYVQDFTIEEIVHYKNIAAGAFRKAAVGMRPVTGLYGMGHLEACLADAVLLNEINDFERALMQNNARPDLIVKYLGGKLDEKEASKLTRMWNQRYRGNQQAGKVQVTDANIEVTPVGFAPKDLQYIEGKRWLRNSIANAFGIPEDLITRENSNRASSVTALTQYYSFTIAPKLRRIEEAINQGLISLYDDNLFCQFENCIPEDREGEIKQDTSDISNGIKSVNEIRVERGLEPYPEEQFNRPKA